MRIEQSMQESLRIAEKRMGMSEKRNRDETTETNDETNPEFVKSSSCKIFI
jgi:hypothetical protein